MKAILLAGFVLGSLGVTTVATATDGDKSVSNAFVLCKLLDNTGQLSEPCAVSGWGSSVSISMDATAAQARSLCPAVRDMLQKQGMVFGERWALKIASPYSGDKAIATCPLG